MTVWFLRAAAVLLILAGCYELHTFLAYWLHRVEPPSFDWSRDPLPDYMAVRRSFLYGYPLITAGVIIAMFCIGGGRGDNSPRGK